MYASPEMAIVCSEEEIVTEVLRNKFAYSRRPGDCLTSLVDARDRWKIKIFYTLDSGPGRCAGFHPLGRRFTFIFFPAAPFLASSYSGLQERAPRKNGETNWSG